VQRILNKSLKQKFRNLIDACVQIPSTIEKSHVVSVLQTPGTTRNVDIDISERDNAKGVGAAECTSWRNGVATWGTLLSQRIPRYDCNRAGRYHGRVSREHAARPSCNQARHSCDATEVEESTCTFIRALPWDLTHDEYKRTSFALTKKDVSCTCSDYTKYFLIKISIFLFKTKYAHKIILPML